MSSNVFICSKLQSLQSNELRKLIIDDFKATNVTQLCSLVAKQLEVNEQCFDLMCFGRLLLSADKSLEHYGIENGCTIFVLKKVVTEEGSGGVGGGVSGAKVKASQTEIQNMVIALRTALVNPLFRNMLDKLSESEARENLMAVTPGLREDSVTFAILQDPDLLTTLTEPSNVHKVLAKHECLLEAATHLAATFHEETIASENSSGGASATSLLGRTSSQYNYSIDGMSDDEDISEVESPAEDQQNATAQHLANIFIRAYQSSHPNQTTPPAPQTSIITPAMLRVALQSSSQYSQPSTSASPGISTSNLEKWSTQLQQMRDMGITDDVVAIRALEMTNGDIQAAVNVIFNS